ncbi:MAG: IS4 family transposase, partial [Limisphaerales bacterium]
TTKDLRNWRLIEEFLDVLRRVALKQVLHPTFSDPRRTLGYAEYLSLFLFGVFNSVVGTMRQLCAITELEKVQQTIGGGRVNLGSFSAAQHVIDPDLLKQVFERLVERLPREGKADARLRHLELIAQDGSLWSALPRMTWAEYGVGRHGQAKGVRLHLRFNILKDGPEDALITPGKGCETSALREMLLPGQTNVGDRFYGHDYKLFAQIDAAKAFFVFRLHDRAVIHSEEELSITAEDAAAGVVRHAWVHLGATEKLRSMRVRLVEIQKDNQRLLLVTNLPPEQNPAGLIGLIYHRRWSIELYFRWIKCILGTRHFFAETHAGVSIQIYLALIASLLLQLFTGTRPNKRVMEFLQMYFAGWATAEELERLIPKYSAPANSAKKR